MKITDLAIVACIILCFVALPFSIKQKRNIEAEQLKMKYNEMVDNAAIDASHTLIESTAELSTEILSEGKLLNYKSAPLNLDKALWRFYQTMYINLGIENDYAAQQAFFDKVPIKLAVGYDGYYINAWTEVRNASTGEMEVKEIWQDKKYYTLYDDKYSIKIDFSLDENVYITDSSGNKVSGNYKNFTSLYPDELAFSDKFDGIRRQVITNCITNDLKYYTEKVNRIAVKNGWQYNFKLPYIGNTSINDICFMAFLQGLPFNGVDYYNTFGFGQSKIIRRKKYYGNVINGKKIYHKEGCSNIGSDPVIFDSAREAVKAGYYPDPECI